MAFALFVGCQFAHLPRTGLDDGAKAYGEAVTYRGNFRIPV